MSLPDVVLLNKAAIIERCVMRAREEYADDHTGFAASLRRQDAAIMNAQRACMAALEMGQHLSHREHSGATQNSLNAFAWLAQTGRISDMLAKSMQQAASLLDSAVHDYQASQLAVVERIILQYLDDFLAYSQTLLKAENTDN